MQRTPLDILTNRPESLPNYRHGSANIGLWRRLIRIGDRFIDDHLRALRKLEKTAYQKVDEAVGLDLKTEKATLANDQYKLSQVGNANTDITQQGISLKDAQQETTRRGD